MPNINVQLKNAGGDILYPQTDWNLVQNKPSIVGAPELGRIKQKNEDYNYQSVVSQGQWIRIFNFTANTWDSVSADVYIHYHWGGITGVLSFIIRGPNSSFLWLGNWDYYSITQLNSKLKVTKDPNQNNLYGIYLNTSPSYPAINIYGTTFDFENIIQEAPNDALEIPVSQAIYQNERFLATNDLITKDLFQ